MKNFACAPIFLLATILATVPASAAPLLPAAHGTFEHYTFALTWQPGFCSTEEPCEPDQPKTPLIGLHGLWASRPQDLIDNGTTDPQWWGKGCDFYRHSDAAPTLEPALQQQLAAVIPHFRRSLLTHEYDKHVQCFNFDANQYFSTELAMHDAVVASPFGKYLMSQAGHDVAHAAVVAQFTAAFATDHPTSLQLQCEDSAAGGKILTQFWITIKASAVDAFPKPESLMDTPTNQDTCPANFRIPAWS